MQNKKLLLLFFSVFLLFGCLGQNNPAQDNGDPNKITPGNSVSVQIKDFKFFSDSLRISNGTVVTWTNNDSAPHTATSSGNFDTGVILQGQSASITFNNSGTFDYICTVHPSMRAEIIVE